MVYVIVHNMTAQRISALTPEAVVPCLRDYASSCASFIEQILRSLLCTHDCAYEQPISWIIILETVLPYSGSLVD